MKLYLILLFLFVTRLCLGQNALSETINMASPTAASLGKFVDLPVSYHTGTPSVEIPIYSVQEGPLQLPITLSYHASGLKVMEQAGWTGSGWALKAGAVITRSTRGNPDEMATTDTEFYYLKDQGYYSYLFLPYATSDVPILAYSAFAKGERDGEADIFFFNCGEYSGSFSFRADKSVVLIPQQDVRVEPFFCEGAGCGNSYEVLYGWRITTPDGVKYYYGKTIDISDDVDPIEHSTPYSTANGISYAKEISSWYLNKIESPDNLRTIKLKYDKEDYGFYTISMFPVPSTSYAPTGGSGINLVKNRINGVRLNSIEFTNGRVEFIPDPNLRQDLSSDGGGLMDYGNDAWLNEGATNARALKQIRIFGDNFDKTFEFDYGYFEDNINSLHGTFGVSSTLESQYNIHSDRKRLKLLSLQEKTTNNKIVKPKYVFTYFDETSVPRTLSLAQDHWGYYNGADNNDELIPSVSTNGGVSLNEGRGSNRESSWPAMRAGALQRIQYPTGGFTEFEFEAHENGYFREYYTYEKNTQLFSKSAGFMGADYTSATEVLTLVSGKYMVEMNGSNLLEGASGQLHIGSNTYTIGSGHSSSTLVDLSAGTYNVYVTVSNPISTGHGVMGGLFSTTPLRHVEYPLIGGLRIKTLKFNDGSAGATDIIQSFDYKDDIGQSQGVLYSRPSYVVLAKNDELKKSGIAIGGSDDNIEGYESVGCVALPAEGYFFSPSSLHPMRTSQGSHIGYNRVKVTQGHGGYTIYRYKPSQNASGDVSIKVIDKTVCDPLAPNFPATPEPHDFSRGELRKVSVYNAAGALLKESNYLSEYTPEAVGVNGLIVKSYYTLYFASEYELKTSKKTKTTSLEWDYSQTTSGLPIGVITETFFDSPNHTFSTRTVISEARAPNINSTEIAQVIKGKVLSETQNKYVADIIIPSLHCNDANTTDAALLSNLSQAFTTYSVATSDCSTFDCKFRTYLDYRVAVNEHRKNYVTNRALYYAQYSDCITSSTTYSQAGTDLKALIDLKNRNEIKGLLESSYWRDGNFLGSSFTTYKQFENNRLFVYPAKKELINSAVPLLPSSFSPVSNNTNSLTKDPKYNQEEIYNTITVMLLKLLVKMA